MINILTKLELPITRVTPAGLKISYSNIKSESTRIKAKLLQNSQTTTIRLPTSKFNVVKMKRSFMTNFIHSLDAANIYLLLFNIFNSYSPKKDQDQKKGVITVRGNASKKGDKGGSDLKQSRHSKIPVYTIHDCFASTPNNMFILDRFVKEAFIEIYFNEVGYLNKLHNHFLEDILSATDEIDHEIAEKIRSHAESDKLAKSNS
jgi:DNA-directed RNA polymerase